MLKRQLAAKSESIKRAASIHGAPVNTDLVFLTNDQYMKIPVKPESSDYRTLWGREICHFTSLTYAGPDWLSHHA